MSHSVALATCAQNPDLVDDDRLVIASLAARNVASVAAIWDDTTIEWDRFDLVVVRSTWDYVGRRAEFIAWARSVPRLANPAAILEWNTDKSYLKDLAEAGVAVIETAWLMPGDEVNLPRSGVYVIKPSESAGGRDTARYDLHDEAAAAAATRHAAALLEAGRTVMVQPYLAAVDVVGESALLFANAEFSHSVRKAALLNPAVPVDDPDEVRITAREASGAEIALAERALDAVPGGAEQLLYARVDMINDAAGDPVILELELTEPSLFLGHVPGAADRFAATIAARVSA